MLIMSVFHNVPGVPCEKMERLYCCPLNVLTGGKLKFYFYQYF
jgi:hypothetical protein